MASRSFSVWVRRFEHRDYTIDVAVSDRPNDFIVASDIAEVTFFGAHCMRGDRC